MKKLTIEEKARRFDEALAIAKDCITYVHDDAVNKYMLGMFPELKEESQEVTYYIPNGFHAEIYDDKVVIKKGEKSAEWSKEDMDIIDGIIMDYEGEIEQLSNSTIDEQAKPIYQDRINFLNRLKSLRHVKQEWSEEDETKLKTACALIRNTSLNGNDGIVEATIEWLKSLKDRVQSQPKQRWNEEDEKMIRALISICDEWATRHSYLPEEINDIEKIKSWLKSYKLKNNITDEELVQAKKDAYNDALDKIEYHSGEPTFDDGWSAAIWYLKKRNAQPQNRWKPSNEQMATLYKYAEQNNYDGSILTALYNELKKLC